MKQPLRIAALVALLICCSIAEAQNLKIISFNIRYNSWNNIDGENGWPHRKASVAKMIEQEKPLAIGLQEALIDQLEYLDSALPSYRRIGVGRDDGKQAGEFMAIYYNTERVELLSGETRWLSVTPETPSKGWDAACFRTVTIARFKVKASGKEFVYLNTHLDHVGKTARAESAKLIATLAKESGEGIPIIVGGDMNSTINDEIFQSFYAEELKAARELAPTKHTDNRITYNAYGKDKGAVIDHFFVRGVKVKSFRTLDGDYGVPYISDHYPVEMVVKY
jgi:endonuclease/exonuclease/phosphatase family metal-dependent hydrolase